MKGSSESMGKKYIVEIGDNENLYKTMITNGGKSYMAVVHGKPYTELDLEQIRKEAYEKGHEDGFIAGHLKAEKSGQSFYEDGYQRGLADAWEAARKIAHCFLWGSYKKETGRSSACAQDVLEYYSASEAIEKIRQYKQEQEEIKVGDEVEVINSGNKYVIAWLIRDEVCGFAHDGVTCCLHKSDVRKTGRHFPEIEAVLEKMRGEKNGSD